LRAACRGSKSENKNLGKKKKEIGVGMEGQKAKKQ